MRVARWAVVAAVVVFISGSCFVFYFPSVLGGASCPLLSSRLLRVPAFGGPNSGRFSDPDRAWPLQCPGTGTGKSGVLPATGSPMQAKCRTARRPEDAEYPGRTINLPSNVRAACHAGGVAENSLGRPVRSMLRTSCLVVYEVPCEVAASSLNLTMASPSPRQPRLTQSVSVISVRLT